MHHTILRCMHKLNYSSNSKDSNNRDINSSRYLGRDKASKRVETQV